MGEEFVNMATGTIAVGEPWLFQNRDYYIIFNPYVAEEIFVDLVIFRLQEKLQVYV